MKLEKWDIWWAEFAYEGMEGSKDRPVVVVSPEEMYVLSAKITSHEARNQWGEYEIIHWRSAGLPKPSTIRLTQLLPLQEEDFRSKIGRLHPEDIFFIERML